MKDLFGEETTPTNEPHKGLRKAEFQHKQLISINGIAEGKSCRNCVHLIRKDDYSKVYLKCAYASDSNCQATDWRAKWQACGLFQQQNKKPQS